MTCRLEATMPPLNQSKDTNNVFLVLSVHVSRRNRYVVKTAKVLYTSLGTLHATNPSCK